MCALLVQPHAAIADLGEQSTGIRGRMHGHCKCKRRYPCMPLLGTCWHPVAKVRLPQGRTLRFVLLGRHCVRQPAFTSRMCNSACMDRGMHGKPGVRWRPQERPSQAAGALGTHTRQAGSAGGRLPNSSQNGAGLRLMFCRASLLQMGPMVLAGTDHHFEPDFVSRRGLGEREELLVPFVCAASLSSHCQCW